jgi:hypothetical protein
MHGAPESDVTLTQPSDEVEQGNKASEGCGAGEIGG